MSAHIRTLLSYLHRVAAPALPDAALLAQWLHQRDQDSFAALMARHGPMVLAVCRRLLGDEQEAEDAFQATFVVLARRAARVRRPEALAGFLYTVARRLARKARAAAKRRPALQGPAELPEPVDPQPQPLDVLSGRELLALIDEEMARLPEVNRLPLLLCLLQGRTVEEAARQLGWSIGSLRGRLTRGREQLRRRLARRGLELSVGAVALLAPAAVPERLLADGLAQLAAPSAAVRALTAGWTSALKLKTICLGLIVLSAVGMGTGLSFFLSSIAESNGVSTPTAPPQAKDEPRRDRYGDPLPPGAIARLGTLRFRLDTHRVEQMAFAPDGKTLAAAASHGLTLFDAASGKQMKTIRSADTSFTRLAYSPDGKRLMTYGVIPSRSHPFPGKTVVQIWDVSDGRKISETELQYVCWVGWSAKDQPRAACLSKDAIVYHELTAGRKLRLAANDLLDPLLVHLCRCVAAENVLTVNGANGSVHMWDLANGKERFTLQPGVFVSSLAISVDGRRLASVSRDAANMYPVQLWDTATGKLVRALPAGREVFFAPDGKTLGLERWGEIGFCDSSDGRERSRIRTEIYSLGQAYAFAPDSKTFATTGNGNGAIQLWDVASGTLKPQPQGHSNRPTGAVFSPDGKRVATCAGLDGTIRIWDSSEGEPLVRIHRNGWPRHCAFSADGRTLYSCWIDDKLFFDDVTTGRELHVQKVADPDRPKFEPSGLSLFLSDDRARLTVFHSGDERGMEMLVTGWDAASRKQLFQRRRVNDAYRNALSADGRTLAAAHAGSPLGQGMQGRRLGEGSMYLEDTASGEKMLTFPSLKGQTAPMVFSPDGRLLVSYTDGPLPSGQRGVTLRLWEVLTAMELRAFPTSFETKAAFTPDGRLLAMPTAKKEILIWDLSQSKEHHRFHEFGAAVTSLTFAPDGRRLVSGLSNSSLLVWDVPSPRTFVAGKLSAEGSAKVWADLAGADAPRAFRARWTLTSAPDETISFLKEHLHPAKAADSQRLRSLLADLDSQQFAEREKAQKELEKLGDLAEAALRQTLANKPNLEMRRRVQALLESLRGPVKRPELLQALRAVAVLEDIGTPEARRLLEELAKGAAGSRLTREATASLQRLERQKRE